MRTISAILLAIIATTAALGQGTLLIGPSTLNGSFEAGVASPWLDIEVAQDPTFASHGAWFGILQSATSPTARDVCFQFLSANRNSGLTFIATFDARNGTVGFDSVYAYLFARNADGTFVYPTATPVASPLLSSSAWGSYVTEFHLPGTWDGVGNISLGMQFTKTGAGGGATYSGYLDNITLRQVPEPSVPALFALATLLTTGLLCFRKRPA